VTRSIGSRDRSIRSRDRSIGSRDQSIGSRNQSGGSSDKCVENRGGLCGIVDLVGSFSRIGSISCISSGGGGKGGASPGHSLTSGVGDSKMSRVLA
jgi:hypothetical protein